MSDGLAFSSADVPPTVPPADTPPNDAPPPASSDLSCEVCGTPLSYSGRGRKPTKCDEHKRSGSTGNRATAVRGSAADVTAALAAMDMMYNLTAGALMMFNPMYAMDFQSRIEQAQTINRAAFESDRKLAKRIGGGTASVAPLMFIGAQAYLIGPVARGMYDRVQESRASRAAQHDAAAETPFAGFGPNGQTA